MSLIFIVLQLLKIHGKGFNMAELCRKFMFKAILITIKFSGTELRPFFSCVLMHATLSLKKRLLNQRLERIQKAFGAYKEEKFHFAILGCEFYNKQNKTHVSSLKK